MGPGVTAGVAHFITKNPFKYPGGTIEVSGGNLNTLRISARYAGHTDNYKFGYKVNAMYMTNGEWELDPADSTDAATMSTFQDAIVDPVNGDTVRYTGGQLTNRGFAYGTNLTLYYRPNDNLSFVGSGGFTYSEGLFWNAQGEGYQAANDYFAQFRTQYDFGKYGNLFAQVYYNANVSPNDVSKKGYLFRSGNISVIDRAQLEVQLQHNFDINPIRTNFVIGTDLRKATFDTGTRTFGRNEQDDDFNIYGGYLQTKTELVKNKLDLVLAGRYDVFNAIDENAFSPRAALVYKVKENMTIRASYNRAYAPNSNLELNIDFPLANAGAFDIWLYGNKNAQTFNDLTTTWLVPGLGETSGLNMDIGTAYAFITGAIAGQIAAGNPDLVALAPFLPTLTDPNTIAAIAATGGEVMGIPIDLDGNLMNIENTTVSKLREDNTLELGFTGVFANKLTVGVDLYQIKRKNFTGLRQISPLVVLPTLGSDLNAAVTNLLTGIVGPELAAQVGGAYQGTADAITSNPLGIVETDQVPGEGDAIDSGLPHLAFGYRNFGKVTYYGMDLSLGYQATKEIKTFANYSWVNKNSFTGSDIGEEEGSTNRYDLNFAQHKLRLGASYEQSGKQGVLGGLNMAYNSEFNSTLGFYDGTVESRFLVDANVGYKLKQGIFLNVAVDNIFNKRYRTFPGMPEIGTRILATVRYTFKPKPKTK
jgi:outer membrane receptor for ferrienterochelin and colicins